MVIVQKLVEWKLAGETEVLGENLLQRHIVHHKSHMTRPGFEPWPPRWEVSEWYGRDMQHISGMLEISCKILVRNCEEPGVFERQKHSASNRNEYQESSWGIKGGRPAGANAWQPHRHLWADCLENVGASGQLFGPPRPVTRIAFDLIPYSKLLRKTRNKSVYICLYEVGHASPVCVFCKTYLVQNIVAHCVPLLWVRSPVTLFSRIRVLCLNNVILK
jgi:hypothetical protein